MTAETTVKENMTDKKKTEGVAQPQTGEGEETIPTEETARGAEAVPKRAAGGKSGTKAPLKRAGLKRAPLKRAPLKRAGAKRASATTAKEGGGGTRATVVKKLLKNIEEKLSGKDVKASLGDYIRLVQLQKELDEEAPREIKVTWVEPGTKTTGKKTEKASENGE
jgi:hypothetical protein